MLTLSQTLSYYKRKDVEALILEQARNKEIGVRFGESFGKRPDILGYENDILESAKQGATSFHISEETWSNPLILNPSLKRGELDELRAGWDLILDIDCPYWSISKLAAYVIIKAIKDHGIESVTVKFSGSKGFHIAVPFESFPERVLGKDVKDLFPEAPRKLAEYILHYTTTSLISISNDKKKILFGKVTLDFDKLLAQTGKSYEELAVARCESCRRIIDEKRISSKTEYICPYCDSRLSAEDKKYMLCIKCGKIMEKQKRAQSICECGSDKIIHEIDLSALINLDTILISSRHMYRMAYSLHEKTGLVSIPFDIRHILKFDKHEADVKTFQPYKFLDRTDAKKGEARALFQKAFDYAPRSVAKSRQGMSEVFKREKREIISSQIIEQEAVPEEFFPPCIKKISAGLVDGKKRALFVLIRFLGACNWDYEKIDDYVMKWNERNAPDKLRETYLKGQLRYYKQQSQQSKEKILPPNCDNRGYMVDTQFCNPDGLCKNIKNPVQYAKKKLWLFNNAKPATKKKRSDESNTKKNPDGR